MPRSTTLSFGAIKIHNVKIRNGNKQIKNAKTTVPNIQITCFRYFITLCDGMVLFFEGAIMFGCCINVFAINAYSINNIANGRKKNIDMDKVK